MNPAILAFLNGAHERLRAAFLASAELSNATKGSLREIGLQSAIEYSLPPIARLYSGDVVDADGNQTGQLDGIVVHASSPALGFREGDPRIVLAEGVLGVIEVKSDLSKQWSQVERTWEKLRKIRRPLPVAGFVGQQFLWGQANMPPSEHAIALFVIGEKAWAHPKTLEECAVGLHKSFGGGPVPPIFVAQLDPPAIGIASPTGRMVGGGHEYESKHVTWPNEARGMVLGNLWMMLTDRARRVLFMDIDWKHYFGEPATQPSAGSQSAAPTPPESSAPTPGNSIADDEDEKDSAVRSK
jgi:hypothetical protein